MSTPIDRSAIEAMEKIIPILEPLTDSKRLFVLRTLWEFVNNASAEAARAASEMKKEQGK